MERNMDTLDHSQTVNQIFYNAELELLILGKLVSDPEDIIDSLKPEYFYNQTNAHICEVALKLQKYDIFTLVEASGITFEEIMKSVETYSLHPVVTDEHIASFIEKYKNRAAYISLEEAKSKIGKIDLAEVSKRLDNINLIDHRYNERTMDDMIDDLQKDLNSAPDPTKIDKMRTGIPTLDRWITTIETGDYILIGAKSSTGKTALGVQLAHRLVQKGNRVLFHSLEMTETALLKRMMRNIHAFDSGKLKTKNFTQKERDRIEGIQEIMRRYKLRIETESSSIKELKAVINKFKPDVVFIDYIQLMDPGTSKGNREQEVANVSREIKKITRLTGIPIVVLTQFNDNFYGRPVGDKPVRESKAPYHDADKVIYLYAPREEAEIQKYEKYMEGLESNFRLTELILEKNREGETGSVMMKYEGKRLYFTEI